MSPFAVFGITSDGLNLVVNLLLLFLAVFWIALVYWTFADARRRISDPMLVGCATAASLFPFAGTMVYMIVRPPEYLQDVHERELEIAGAEVRLAATRNLTCSYCNYQIEGSFLRCPSCLRRLKERCATCHKPLDPSWKICPYCESEIGRPAAQPRRRQRPRESPVAAVAPEGSRQAAPKHQRPAAAEPESERQVAASRAPRRAASEGGRAASSAQRRPAASPGEARHEPAASAGETDRRPPSSSGGSQRPPKQPRNASPAADGRGKREGRTNRPSSGTQRPTVRDEPQRPSGNDRQKRSGTPGGKQRPASQTASDAVTAEQPVARPRTRPPSAG